MELGFRNGLPVRCMGRVSDLDFFSAAGPLASTVAMTTSEPPNKPRSPTRSPMSKKLKKLAVTGSRA